VGFAFEGAQRHDFFGGIAYGGMAADSATCRASRRADRKPWSAPLSTRAAGNAETTNDRRHARERRLPLQVAVNL